MSLTRMDEGRADVVCRSDGGGRTSGAEGAPGKAPSLAEEVLSGGEWPTGVAPPALRGRGVYCSGDSLEKSYN